MATKCGIKNWIYELWGIGIAHPKICLCHEDYFELVTFKNCRHERKSLNSRIQPFVRDIYTCKGNLHL